ncbi:alcohol acetyltransferase-domain-containing protein [Mycena sp. CBHHK59/15]|nr:alcohol acetyltransferase-domain-containing protein [Mycena sp. CBHHK59/15]
MPSPTRLRAVGLLERYHTTRHLLGLDSCVLVAAKYTCADGSILNKELVFPALRKAIATHPVLGVKFEGEATSKPFFVALETIELPRVVQFSDADNLEAALQSQLSRRFDTLADLPLWRIEVLKDNTVIFAFHHAIGDGLSGVAFHTSLLAALQDVKGEDDSPTVVIPQSLKLLPPIEVATSLWPSVRKIASEVFALLAPTSWTWGSSAWTANSVLKTPSLEPRVKLFTLPASDMVKFSAACRANSATITSAFYELAVSLLSRIVAQDFVQYNTLSCFVAVSLRTVAGAPADAMCDYRQKHAAREEIGMLAFLFGNIAGYFRAQLGRKRGGTFELSNAGRVLAAAPAGRWRIGRMAFAQCNVVVGAALTMNVIGDPTGAVNIAVTWGEASIDDELVEAFVAQFQEGFHELIS